MNRARDALLAGPRLSEDQHSDMRVAGNAQHMPLQRTNLVRPAVDLREWIVSRRGDVQVTACPHVIASRGWTPATDVQNVERRRYARAARINPSGRRTCRPGRTRA